MPTTEGDKIEKQSNNENALGDSSAAPFKQAITTIEHKIRNLEKQKAELESYRELHTTSTSKIAEVNMSMYKPPGPGAGFMDSFLKFLQNERVTSPPTTTTGRGGRRQSWKRSKTSSQQSEVRSDSNSIHVGPIPSPISRLSQGDSQDDLSLPKERKRDSFDSSDDGFSSDDNFVNKKKSPAIKPEPPPKERSTRKGRPPKSERKKARSNSDQEWEDDGNLHHTQEKQVTVPRRESSKRAAKEKCIIKRLMASDDETGGTSDSDSDPAWTPQVKEVAEDDVVKSSIKKRKRGRPAGRRKTVQNSPTKESEEPGIEDTNSESIEITKKNEESSDSDSELADTPQAKEDSEDDSVKPAVKKGKRGRPAGQRKTVENSIAKASEEPRIEDTNSQPTEMNKENEINKENEKASDSDSELTWPLQGKGDSEDDAAKPAVKKGKRLAGHRKVVQNSVSTTSEYPEDEDSDSQSVETKRTDDMSDSNSDTDWTPQTNENSEYDVAKPSTKKGKRAGRRKIVQDSDATASKEKHVENKDGQPVETTKKIEETTDSESSPDWTPQGKEVSEGDTVKPLVKKGKRGRPAGRKKTAMTSEEPLDEDTDSQSIEETKRQKNKKETQRFSNVQSLENNARSQMVLDRSLPANLPEDGLFKFVVIKSELKEEWPAIWRVDGKSLLQKYEPFEQNGQTLYRNISTFISWTPESKRQYVTVPVKYRSQSRLETVVEFLKNEMTVVDYEFLEKNIEENEIYQDSFEVYIQALISQALDSNFLKEIIQEQDDYFLSRVKSIDEITSSKKRKLLCVLRWPHPVLVAVNTWPCFNIIRELSIFDAANKFCAACSSTEVSVQVLMYGQPYNSTTLEGCQPDPHIVSEKNFLMCRLCANRVQLFNKITHQKYLLYIECAKRVTIKRTADPHKDTTCILNEFLADDNWLNQLFLEVRSTWGEVDSLYLQYQEPKNSAIPVS